MFEIEKELVLAKIVVCILFQRFSILQHSMRIESV